MLIQGDARSIPLLDKTVQMCVTSPPYWGLRDYGVVGQIGLEPTPDEYVATMVGVFREVWRVLRDDGTVWLNLGDSYSSGGRKDRDPSLISRTSGVTNRAAGLDRSTPEWAKPKDLLGIPWMVAFALRADGWYLRSDIVWAKPNPMPESVTDRPTRSHEYLFLLAKQERYYYDADAIREVACEGYDLGLLRGRNAGPDDKVAWHAPSILKRQQNGVDSRTAGTGFRNKRSVWTINSEPTPEAHFATFPQKLIEPCILAGSRSGDIVLDPFIGSGTVGKVCEKYGRRWIGIELSPQYLFGIARRRTAQMGLRL